MAGLDEDNMDNTATPGLGGEQQGPDFTYDREGVGNAERSATSGGGGAEKDEANQLPSQGNDLNYSADDKDKKGKKRGGVFSRRGGLIGIVLTGVGLISATFLGSSALPFSILGNMNSKSVLNGLQQYADDYYGFVVFGKTNSSRVKVSATGEKLKGLRDTEVAQLKLKKVEFEPAGGTKTKTGRFVFDKVRVDGGAWVDASNFREAMKDSSFRAAMRFEKGSLWKSAKSQAFMAIKNMFKLNSNPDLKGDTPEDSAKKLVGEATDDVASSVDGPTAGKDDPKASQKQQGLAVAGELGSEINTEKAAINAGTANLTALAADGDMSNVGYLMSKLGVDVTTATKNIGQQIWGFVNVLDPLDMVCTVYQTAYTANMISRTIILYNVVKFGMTMITAIERAQAGEDTDNSMSNLMSLLTQTDPNTGRSFTASSYASFLFNGELSSEPSSVSTFGGSAMLMLYTAMHALHSSLGTIMSAGTAGDINSARVGRAFLKNTCGIASNIGVQIGATAASIVVGIFSGGTSFAAQTAAKTGLSVGFKQAIKVIAEKFGKEAIENTLKKKWEEIVAEGLIKTMAKDSWVAAKSLFKGMSVWDKLGFLMAGVSTFGMSYIVHALSGGTVAGYTKNPVSTMDALGTARQQTDFLTGLGAGGTVATYSQATAYESTRKEYETAYIEDMQYAAKSTPFDIKNPYSAAGRVAYSIQQTIGVPTSTDPLSTLAAIATLPFKLTKADTANAAAESMTPEAVGQYIGNEFYMGNQIAQNITGSPQLIFQKDYSFSDVIAKLVDSDNPQMTFDGFDNSTSEPKLSIIPGSSLATYVDTCKNPAKAELDPEFEDEEAHNLYDIDTCVKGGKGYNNDMYPLYDDALRYANQVNPSATAIQSNTQVSGRCPAGSTVADSITQGYWGGKYQDAVFCAIDNTTDGSLSSIRDADLFKQNNTILQTNDTGKVVVMQDAAQDMIDLVKTYGKTFDVTFSYRSHAQQCLMYFYDHSLSILPVECQGGKLTDTLAKSLSKQMSGNYTMPGDFYESRHESGHGFDASDLAWVEKCASQNLDGNDSKYKSGSCFNFVPKHIPDDAAHVAWEGGT
jgi:hypothetical protein